jgi:lipopolysaccharide/colanic/teichoic acid biosynthesis glycosyltransferase
VEREHEQVARAATEVAWESALPPRASGKRWRTAQTFKRLLDLGIAGTALVALIPAFFVLGVAILLDSGWPVFYPWYVVGYRGRRFTGYKLRSMVRNADQLKPHLEHLNEMNGPTFKIRDDPRRTRFGTILRRYSIDELPQLWSVIVGDMSLVGPRPMSPQEFIRATPRQRRKLAVMPGITGLWQVSGRADIAEFEEWVRLDLQYIAEWSPWMDLSILARTPGAVLSRRGAY